MKAYTNFYYNVQINVCAEENWVIDYLIENGYCKDKEEALDGLRTRTRREFCGWIDCEVSDTIEELISNHCGM